jgi:serine/threonine protein kinase
VYENLAENARDLMKHMLRPDPDIRISAWDAIQHDYLRAYQEPSELDADPIECKGNLNNENSVINLEFKGLSSNTSLLKA